MLKDKCPEVALRRIKRPLINVNAINWLFFGGEKRQPEIRLRSQAKRKNISQFFFYCNVSVNSSSAHPPPPPGQ